MLIFNFRFMILLMVFVTISMFLSAISLLNSGPSEIHHRQDASGLPSHPEPRLIVQNPVQVQSVGNRNKLRMRIAYAVTITKDGPYLDGAAVLVHSIKQLKTNNIVDLVAIVHPQVQTTRPALEKLGFKMFEREGPIKSSEIEGKHLRETIDKSGCCGALELLKLRAYELEEYDRVVLLDMDTVIVKSMDHLFTSDKEILFTYDYAMDGRGSKAPPVQGGLLIIRPNKDTFAKMIDIVREGDFRPGTGWGGQNIGWCWGGQTVQGLVSFYYNIVDPSNSIALHHCKYNAMVSTKDCEDTPFDEIVSVHFTVCQKPWDCRPSDKKLCKQMIKYWWDVRRSLEEELGLPLSTTNGCHHRHEYKSIDLL